RVILDEQIHQATVENVHVANLDEPIQVERVANQEEVVKPMSPIWNRLSFLLIYLMDHPIWCLLNILKILHDIQPQRDTRITQPSKALKEDTKKLSKLWADCVETEVNEYDHDVVTTMEDEPFHILPHKKRGRPSKKKPTN
ncbi:unnamed protein product, partial [Sphenostylis stenocarpa]